MKNNAVSILACACLVLSAFLGGLFLGRNIRGDEIQVSVLNPPSASTNSATTGPAASRPREKVNINTADLETLMTLDGIGETYAQRIIDYREKNGPFKTIEDIKNVTGIGDKRFELIKDFITVGG